MIEDFSHSLFTLFHHKTDTTYQYDSLLATKLNEFSKHSKIIPVSIIAEAIKNVIKNQITEYSDREISLTLTGGMDSRVLLAAFLNIGIKPVCMTFGNPKNVDAINAKIITTKLNLTFDNVCQIPPTKEWYFHWIKETINKDNGNSHLHRAHRTASIFEHTEKYHPKILFTGHMGGESLRGLSYNNYFSSPFFKCVNEGRIDSTKAAIKVLRSYFINTDNINFTNLMEEVNKLPWMRHDRETNKFYFLYDLVAKIHHMQDLRLYNYYVPNVVPVFLQNDYLKTIYSSTYNYLSNKRGFSSRLQNPYIYCKIIEYLYPPLLEYPFSNGFTPKDYLRGLFYYIPVKLYYNYKKKNTYPPTFSYGQWYIDFVQEHSQNISPEIWDIYNKKAYFSSLKENKHQTDEGYWHKYSNPIFFDLINKNINTLTS